MAQTAYFYIMLVVVNILVPRLPLEIQSAILEVFQHFQYCPREAVYAPKDIHTHTHTQNHTKNMQSDTKTLSQI